MNNTKNIRQMIMESINVRNYVDGDSKIWYARKNHEGEDSEDDIFNNVLTQIFEPSYTKEEINDEG